MVSALQLSFLNFSFTYILWTSLVAQRVKRLPSMQETWVQSLAGKISWRGNDNPLQYSCLENPMDGEAWWATVHGVAKSWTQLSDFTHFTIFYSLFPPKYIYLMNEVILLFFSLLEEFQE